MSSSEPRSSFGSDSNEATSSGPRLLITAGPTHEPIDAVRYLANRSSGRLGVALADAAAESGWRTTLLLGPTALACAHTQVRTLRFQTTADLEALLREHAGECDVLVMAAAVADYRPIQKGEGQQKIQRTGERLVLELESTPDLLAGVAKRKKSGQLFVGFALEPAERLMERAREKLVRKHLDAIVANPLETMDSTGIEATLVGPDGVIASTPGRIPKTEFADWLLERIEGLRVAAGGR
ncbi:MAG: phosphopantothenoylcysteine decarboxylase [Planctomycetota bacterium]|nr:phosphopantothenoylcysteine decarboxylase [Planctomycetota bacterium]